MGLKKQKDAESRNKYVFSSRKNEAICHKIRWCPLYSIDELTVLFLYCTFGMNKKDLACLWNDLLIITPGSHLASLLCISYDADIL